MYEFETIENDADYRFVQELNEHSKDGWEIVSSGCNDWHSAGSYSTARKNWWAIVRRPLEIGEM